ncbi:phage/plasmid primase, P4 family [Bradyrhizobium sp. AUGA SZCCT0177]|uniref:phage/plasmid primase, P4 family n=1 Tax=Bradyrhizobium sp. AUGA SZCCT0177 TaxID=2807665 RepID=UPI0032DF21D6
MPGSRLSSICALTTERISPMHSPEQKLAALGIATERPKPSARGQPDAVGEEKFALEFADRYDGRFVYDHDRGGWFRWTGEIWLRDTDEYALDCVRALVREFGGSRVRVATAVERAARTDRRLARDHGAWNADPLLLGVPGGVVDLRTGTLLPPKPAQMINMATGSRLAAPGTPCPLWMNFLHDATRGDESLQRFLQQRAGYWLTGDTSREDFDFFHGPGGNGKGVFLKTITSIMGNYAASAPIGMFLATKHDAHPTELARLADARLVVASETEEGRAWNTAKVKQLTGNEVSIPARFMKCDFFEFQPKFKICFVGNAKPAIRTVDDAIARRLNLVPFTFKPAQSDSDLKQKLEIEYPAILRWMVDGWLDMQANGPVRPEVIAAATEQYLNDENIIGAWIAENCIRGPSASQLLKELYADWRQWCEANQEQPGTNRGFKKKLERLGDMTFRPSMRSVVVKGLRCSTEYDREPSQSAFPLDNDGMNE